jgi:hypothetical protein
LTAHLHRNAETCNRTRLEYFHNVNKLFDYVTNDGLADALGIKTTTTPKIKTVNKHHLNIKYYVFLPPLSYSTIIARYRHQSSINSHPGHSTMCHITHYGYRICDAHNRHDQQTIEYCPQFARYGHLCLDTLESTSAKVLGFVCQRCLREQRITWMGLAKRHPERFDLATLKFVVDEPVPLPPRQPKLLAQGPVLFRQGRIE